LLFFNFELRSDSLTKKKNFEVIVSITQVEKIVITSLGRFYPIPPGSKLERRKLRILYFIPLVLVLKVSTNELVTSFYLPLSRTELI
jgi:hypothetical protein